MIENLKSLIVDFANFSFCDNDHESVKDGILRLVDRDTASEIIRFRISKFLSFANRVDSSIYHGAGIYPAGFVKEVIEKFKTEFLSAKEQFYLVGPLLIFDLPSNWTARWNFIDLGNSKKQMKLLEGAASTNFTYEVITPSDFDPTSINSLRDHSECQILLDKLKEHGCQIRFYDIENVIFKQNLTLIETNLPRILGEALYCFYSGQSGSDMLSLLRMIKAKDPLNLGAKTKHPIYEHKLRTMLTDMALGMTSGTVWNGRYTAVGGFIIVKEDGDIICYHVYDKDEFQDFLMHHSKFDIPDSGRHEFGKVFKDCDRYFIKLNLQIRYST